MTPENGTKKEPNKKPDSISSPSSCGCSAISHHSGFSPFTDARTLSSASSIACTQIPPVLNIGSTLRCRAGHLWMERQVLLTVEPAGFHQLWAAGVMARCLWSVWHGSVLPRKISLTEVTVSTDLVVVHVQQSQSLDDTLRSQVVAVMDIGFDEVQRLMLRAEALYSHAHRL